MILIQNACPFTAFYPWVNGESQRTIRYRFCIHRINLIGKAIGTSSTAVTAFVLFFLVCPFFRSPSYTTKKSDYKRTKFVLYYLKCIFLRFLIITSRTIQKLTYVLWWWKLTKNAFLGQHLLFLGWALRSFRINPFLIFDVTEKGKQTKSIRISQGLGNKFEKSQKLSKTTENIKCWKKCKVRVVFFPRQSCRRFCRYFCRRHFWCFCRNIGGKDVFNDVLNLTAYVIPWQ